MAALPADHRLVPWRTGTQFVDLAGGSGLLGHNTDFNGDQFGDVLATRPDGSLWAYLGNGAGGWLGQPLVGDGWQIADAMFFAGDFARQRPPGDALPEELRRLAVDVHDERHRRLEPATGRSGPGWDIFSAVFSPGDFTGDGNPDVMGLRRYDGTLWLYPGAGNGGWGAP